MEDLYHAKVIESRGYPPHCYRYSEGIFPALLKRYCLPNLETKETLRDLETGIFTVTRNPEPEIVKNQHVNYVKGENPLAAQAIGKVNDSLKISTEDIDR
jgi:hypothetical protein